MKKVIAWLPAAATLLLAALLIAQCIGIYLDGTAPENFENGALIHDIFSRETAVSRLRGIAWAFWVWVAALAIGLAFRVREKGMIPMPAEARRELVCAHVVSTPEMEAEVRKRRRANIISGAVLLVLGIMALIYLLLPGSFDSWDLESELAAALLALLPLGLLGLAALLVRSGYMQRSFAREIELAKAAPKRKPPLPVAPVKEHKGLRIGLYIAAIALVCLGVANGGARDVLVKAINICTECIGLG